MLDKYKYVSEDAKKKFQIQVTLDKETYFSAPLDGTANAFAEKFYGIIGQSDCFKMTLENMSYLVIGKDAISKAVFIFRQLGE